MSISTFSRFGVVLSVLSMSLSPLASASPVALAPASTKVWAYILRQPSPNADQMSFALGALQDTVAVSDTCQSKSRIVTYTPHALENDSKAYGVMTIEIVSDCAQAAQALLEQFKNDPRYLIREIAGIHPVVTGSN